MEINFPPIKNVSYYDKNIEKSISKLAPEVQRNYKRFLEQLKTQTITPGRRLRCKKGICTVRLGKQYRLSFQIVKNTIVILFIDKHNGYERYLSRI